MYIQGILINVDNITIIALCMIVGRINEFVCNLNVIFRFSPENPDLLSTLGILYIEVSLLDSDKFKNLNYTHIIHNAVFSDGHLNLMTGSLIIYFTIGFN